MIDTEIFVIKSGRFMVDYIVRDDASCAFVCVLGGLICHEAEHLADCVGWAIGR